MDQFLQNLHAEMHTYDVNEPNSLFRWIKTGFIVHFDLLEESQVVSNVIFFKFYESPMVYACSANNKFYLFVTIFNLKLKFYLCNLLYTYILISCKIFILNVYFIN